MWVGGYSLDMYCSTEDEKHRLMDFPHQFCGETRAEVLRQAKAKGWKFDPRKRNAPCYCPKCEDPNGPSKQPAKARQPRAYVNDLMLRGSDIPLSEVPVTQVSDLPWTINKTQ